MLMTWLEVTLKCSQALPGLIVLHWKRLTNGSTTQSISLKLVWKVQEAHFIFLMALWWGVKNHVGSAENTECLKAKSIFVFKRMFCIYFWKLKSTRTCGNFMQSPLLCWQNSPVSCERREAISPQLISIFFFSSHSGSGREKFAFLSPTRSREKGKFVFAITESSINSRPKNGSRQTSSRSPFTAYCS